MGTWHGLFLPQGVWGLGQEDLSHCLQDSARAGVIGGSCHVLALGCDDLKGSLFGTSTGCGLSVAPGCGLSVAWASVQHGGLSAIATQGSIAGGPESQKLYRFLRPSLEVRKPHSAALHQPAQTTRAAHRPTFLWEQSKNLQPSESPALHRKPSFENHAFRVLKTFSSVAIGKSKAIWSPSLCLIFKS